MNKKLKKSATITTILLMTALLSILFMSFSFVNAQNNEAIVIIQASEGGTTDPTPGNYTYAENTNILLTAIPNDSYAFQYWVASGSVTPGATDVSPPSLTDPNTGEPVPLFPSVPSNIQNIVTVIFQDNPANVTCGYGYIFEYTAVFAPITPAAPEKATVVILPSNGGSTTPSPGTYTYDNGVDIVLTATPATGYEFQYWVASGNFTVGHENTEPSVITDPETGEIIQIPNLPSIGGINNLTFTQNPATITCGYGYTFNYQAVFAPAGTASPSPTVTPTEQPTETPTMTPSPTMTPTASPTPEPTGGLVAEVIIAIVVIVIIIIVAIAVYMLRR